MTERVGELQGHQGRLNGRVLELEEQNTSLGEEAVSLQKRLDASMLQQHQVSFATGLLSLHLRYITHTGMCDRRAFCKRICLPASLLWEMAHLSLVSKNMTDLAQGSVCLCMCHHQMSLFESYRNTPLKVLPRADHYQ